MYHDAASQLSVSAKELLHIGDLEPTDVAGALTVGAQAGLFAGDNDRFLGKTKAQYTFTRWEDFLAILPALANNKN